MTHEQDGAEGSSFDASAKPFRMVSIYDSARTSAEAAYASEVVLRELGEEIAVDKCSWDLQALECSSVRDIAASEAARADLIVISLSSETPSSVLKLWIALWEKNRELATGLIALIPGGESKTGGDLAEFLYETAVSTNMDFLCRKKRRY